MRLDYEFASEPTKDFITVYWKGQRKSPIVYRTLKKVKQNKYRTKPYKNDKGHYFTVNVYKKKIILKGESRFENKDNLYSYIVEFLYDFGNDVNDKNRCICSII